MKGGNIRSKKNISRSRGDNRSSREDKRRSKEAIG